MQEQLALLVTLGLLAWYVCDCVLAALLLLVPMRLLSRKVRYHRYGLRLTFNWFHGAPQFTLDCDQTRCPVDCSLPRCRPRYLAWAAAVIAALLSSAEIHSPARATVKERSCRFAGSNWHNTDWALLCPGMVEQSVAGVHRVISGSATSFAVAMADPSHRANGRLKLTRDLAISSLSRPLRVNTRNNLLNLHI